MKHYTHYHWLLSCLFYTLVVFVAYQIVFNPSVVNEWWHVISK